MPVMSLKQCLLLGKTFTRYEDIQSHLFREAAFIHRRYAALAFFFLSSCHRQRNTRARQASIPWRIQGAAPGGVVPYRQLVLLRFQFLLVPASLPDEPLLPLAPLPEALLGLLLLMGQGAVGVVQDVLGRRGNSHGLLLLHL